MMFLRAPAIGITLLYFSFFSKAYQLKVTPFKQKFFSDDDLLKSKIDTSDFAVLSTQAPKFIW